MFTYRTAQPADSRLYFDWANDPDTRKWSFNSAPISLETHTAWFTRKLTDPNSLLLLFFDDAKKPVGQVRFERKSVADMPDEIIISTSVDARQRGRGYAAQLIAQGCAVCRKHWEVVTIHAYIKPDNQASIKTFERVGFKLLDENNISGDISLVYSQSY
ncbi:hypothetical protein GCM10027592_51140 [Spirosoma flavus]